MRNNRKLKGVNTVRFNFDFFSVRYLDPNLECYFKFLVAEKITNAAITEEAIKKAKIVDDEVTEADKDTILGKCMLVFLFIQSKLISSQILNPKQ